MPTAMQRQARLGWYGSFYWRIGISFVVFLIVVLVAQSMMFSYMLMRSNEQNPAGSPNNIATAVAVDLGSALESNPGLDLNRYLPARYGTDPSVRVYVIMRNGTIAGNSERTLPDDIRRSAQLTLERTDLRYSAEAPRLSGPVVTAPIQVGNELRGLVVLPPPPPGPPPLRDVGRLLSLPGILLLLAATIGVVVIIFAPARRRLSALEQAAERLGRGDLMARAPDDGADEIARVAGAFNRMASELAARDEALRTADRLRRQMLADVSHELKTPLTAMRGYIETLRMPDVALDEPRRDRYFETIDRETQRLERLVKDLVDLARYENGAVALDVRVFDIARLFDQVGRRHEQEAQARQVALRMDVPDGTDQIVGDADRIEQVIENLVANALRHTPAGGAITLAARTTAGRAVLTVTDTGEGIAPEHLPYVFERFYKVDSSRTAASGGSGLGLSIAKVIVERHGGVIRVSSAPRRTVFTIELPQPPHSPSTNL